MTPLCEEMEASGLDARRLDLLFERVDRQVIALRAGTVRPSRHAGHLVRLLTERLETVDPGLGIKAIHLIVPLAEPLRWEQQDSGTGPQQVARLLDRLSNRLGNEHVYRAAPVETPLPEHLVQRRPPSEAAEQRPGKRAAPAMSLPPAFTLPQHAKTGSVLKLVASAAKPFIPETAHTLLQLAPPMLKLVPAPEPEQDRHHQGQEKDEAPVVLPWKPRHDAHGFVLLAEPDAWPSRLKPPARLLAPPRPVLVIAALPDEAPVAFTWRCRHKVLRAEEPGRIHETWWNGDHAADAVRDYFQVEVEGGQRFWLFRRGNGLDLRTGDLTWFVHGLF